MIKAIDFKPEPALLVHPNIPKPLHGVNPRSIKGQEWWDAERRKAYKSTGCRCAACGVHQSQILQYKHLEAHEIYDIDYNAGLAVFKRIVPLCRYCHAFIHSGLTNVLRDQRKITNSEHRRIFEQSYAILASAGLKPFVYPKSSVAWNDWRLMFEGKEYKPKFSSYAEWASHYNYGERIPLYTGYGGSKRSYPDVDEPDEDYADEWFEAIWGDE